MPRTFDRITLLSLHQRFLFFSTLDLLSTIRHRLKFSRNIIFNMCLRLGTATAALGITWVINHLNGKNIDGVASRRFRAPMLQIIIRSRERIVDAQPVFLETDVLVYSAQKEACLTHSPWLRIYIEPPQEVPLPKPPRYICLCFLLDF